MTISTTTTKVSYSGDGSTTAFAVPYKFFDEGDLLVILTDASGNETTQVITTNYTVSGGGTNGGTGTVNMVTAPSGTQTLTITLNLSNVQNTDLVNFDGQPAQVLETALDKAALRDQQLAEDDGRAIKLKISSTQSNLTVDDTTSNTGKVAFVKADGNIGWQTLAADASVLGSYDSATFDGDNSTTDFALGFTPPAQNGLLVWVDDDRLVPGTDYTVSGSTLSFTTAPATGSDNIEVLNVAGSASAVVPTDGSVTNTKLDKTVITAQTTATPSASDFVLIADASDGLNLKNASITSILSLVSNGFASSDITGQTSATVAAGDSFVFTDVSDSDNLKKDTVQGILDLVPAFASSDITGQTSATIAASDILIFADASDSNNLKRDTVQGIVDLVPVSTTYGAVGTYSLFQQTGGSPVSAGGTIAGSSLTYGYMAASTGVWTNNGGNPTGTWRTMSGQSDTTRVSIWVRTA